MSAFEGKADVTLCEMVVGSVGDGFGAKMKEPQLAAQRQLRLSIRYAVTQPDGTTKLYNAVISGS
jgi:hypothetical protein